MVFKIKIYAKKRQIGEVRGDARPWLMARRKPHGRLSNRLN